MGRAALETEAGGVELEDSLGFVVRDRPFLKGERQKGAGAGCG